MRGKSKKGYRRNGKYKFTGIMLAVALCIATILIPINARANSNIQGNCGENVSWTYDGATKTLKISGKGEMEQSSSAFSNYDIENVTIEEGITKIYRYTFSNCSKLKNISIPSSVNEIEIGAFSDCNSLTSINIPEGVEAIDQWTFSGCCGLTNVKLPNSVTSIGMEAFYSCSSLKNIDIPNSVHSIGSGAFEECRALENINIPNNVEYINGSAFSSCEALTSIFIPSSVVKIYDGAFSNCTNLKKIDVEIGNKKYVSVDGVLYDIKQETLCAFPGGKEGAFVIPQSVRTINGKAFVGCNMLTEVTIPNGIETIGVYAFSDCIKLRSITIPSSVTWIGEGAFNGCIDLESINVDEGNAEYASFEGVVFDKNKEVLSIYPCGKAGGYIVPSFVKGIRTYAFNGCYKLTDVEITDNVTYIGDGAFTACTGLKTVKLSNGITYIASELFSFCDGLTNIDIPNNVTAIYDGAFYGCESLNRIVLPDSVTEIDSVAFAGCRSLTSINIPANVSSIGSSTFANCDSLTSINVSEGNSEYSSKDGVLFDKNKTILCVYPGGKSGKYTVPSTVKTIGGYAFSGCEGLEEVILPNSLENIGYYSFMNCPLLKEIFIPDSVISITIFAIENCGNATPNNPFIVYGSADEPDDITSYTGTNVAINYVKERDSSSIVYRKKIVEPIPEPEPAPMPTTANVYLHTATKDIIIAGLVTDVADKTKYEYSWYALKDGESNWRCISDWKNGDEWLNWTPDSWGDYTIEGRIRVVGDGNSSVKAQTNVSFHPHIKGKCQMPYSGEQGTGYLIGVESYDNPDQKYQYEMLILDCTLLAQGLPAWTYTTGQFRVPEGNAGWCIWTPQYGYYWTLFRVYDENGVLIDEQCYGFANIC